MTQHPTNPKNIIKTTIALTRPKTHNPTAKPKRIIIGVEGVGNFVTGYLSVKNRTVPSCPASDRQISLKTSRVN